MINGDGNWSKMNGLLYSEDNVCVLWPWPYGRCSIEWRRGRSRNKNLYLYCLLAPWILDHTNTRVSAMDSEWSLGSLRYLYDTDFLWKLDNSLSYLFNLLELIKIRVLIAVSLTPLRWIIFPNYLKKFPQFTFAWRLM